MTVIYRICYIVAVCSVAIAGVLFIEEQDLALGPLMISPIEHIDFQKGDDERPESHHLVTTHTA
ncbi:MAG TPA: hypothetical protein VLC92_08690 [Rhodocyclaceae bacterium]|nr:hypothetical protein [Rhodocyclaceae bacterium]